MITEDNGWENVKINLDELTRKKLGRDLLESYEDFGSDGCDDLYENGHNATGTQCIYDEAFSSCNLEENLTLSTICNELEYYLSICPDIINITDVLNEDGNMVPDGNGIYDVCETDDPNGDNCIDEVIDESCTQDNGSYDTGENVDFDENNNGLYDPPPEYMYNEDNEFWFWNDGISEPCGLCNQLIIKGEPAINRIDYIMVGIINNTDEQVYGRVLLNELRRSIIIWVKAFLVKIVL